MTDYRARYRLEPRRLGMGGQAEVFQATDRKSGKVVALKRLIDTQQSSVDRMRREIEIQQAIRHDNVMPILEHDADHRWFSMPLARRSLNEVPTPIPDAVIADVVGDVARGLAIAHNMGVVHRDVKPSNVLQLGSSTNEARWVVSDWGLLRGPRGETTAHHTQTGVLLGTLGFAPPESYLDAHQCGPSGDVYSLGRIVAWASTGQLPQPHVPLVPTGKWRRFVRRTTYSEPARRPQTMPEVLELLLHVLGSREHEPDVRALVSAARSGDTVAARHAFKAALEAPDDEELFIDEIATLQDEPLEAFVTTEPQDAQRLLELMDRHLENVHWGYRDFNYYNVPLGWIHQVARYAAADGNLDLMEEACDSLFRLEPPWDRWSQAAKSRSWLAELSGNAARRVAEILRDHPEAARYYGRLNHARDSRIREVLREAAETR